MGLIPRRTTPPAAPAWAPSWSARATDICPLCGATYTHGRVPLAVLHDAWWAYHRAWPNRCLAKEE